MCWSSGMASSPTHRALCLSRSLNLVCKILISLLGLSETNTIGYYTALSLAPLVLLIVGVIGLVLDRQQVGSQLSAQLEGLIGPAGRELVTSILTATNPQGGTIATIIGLATLLIGATAVFGELQATLNLIWEVQPAPTNGVWAGIWALLRDRIFS